MNYNFGAQNIVLEVKILSLITNYELPRKYFVNTQIISPKQLIIPPKIQKTNQTNLSTISQKYPINTTKVKIPKKYPKNKLKLPRIYPKNTTIVYGVEQIMILEDKTLTWMTKYELPYKYPENNPNILPKYPKNT